MKLPQIDLAELKKLRGKKRQEKIQEFEQKKQSLFENYVKLQDIIDEYNDTIYGVECEIEQVNMVIEALKTKTKAKTKAKAKTKKSKSKN